MSQSSDYVMNSAGVYEDSARCCKWLTHLSTRMSEHLSLDAKKDLTWKETVDRLFLSYLDSAKAMENDVGLRTDSMLGGPQWVETTFFMASIRWAEVTNTFPSDYSTSFKCWLICTRRFTWIVSDLASTYGNRGIPGTVFVSLMHSGETFASGPGENDMQNG